MQSKHLCSTEAKLVNNNVLLLAVYEVCHKSSRTVLSVSVIVKL